MSPTSIFLPKNPHSSNIITMFNDEVSSDLLFEVADQPGGISASKRARSTTSFHAHRIILNKCKSTLLGELCKPNGESVTVVSITDVGTDIFHHMLYYIYYLWWRNIWRYFEGECKGDHRCCRQVWSGKPKIGSRGIISWLNKDYHQ